MKIIEFINRYFLFPKDIIPQAKMFKWEHLLCFILAIIFIVTCTYKVLKEDLNQRKKWLKIMAIIMISLEFFRIIWWLLCRYDSNYNFFINLLQSIRFDWCNQVCLVMPIIILLKKEKAYDIIVPMAFIGGIGVLLYPISVFDDYAGLHLMSIQSYMSHALMVFIAILFVLSKTIKPNYKHWPRLMVGFLFSICIAASMAYLLPGARTNYMNIKKSIIPLINLIPHPYYLIFQFVFMLEAIFYVYFIIILFNRHKENSKVNKNEKNLLLINFSCTIIALICFTITCLAII